MSRLTDKRKPEAAPAMPPLPVIDWKAINNSAPVLLPVDYQGPTTALPKADMVVITWTNAEWSAFDHVFCNSGTERTASDTSWQTDWLLYTKGAPPPPATGTDYHLWGYYRMVQITGQSGKALTVLLFKAQAHLAYDPYLSGLQAMTNAVLADTGAAYMYSIGTAGGPGDDGLLGNTVITNSGHLMMTNPNNDGSPLNNQTFSCTNWFPSFTLMEAVQQSLLYPLSNVANWEQYNYLYGELCKNMYNDGKPKASMEGIAVTDLVNKPLNPDNLKQAQTTNCKDKPLLTTDFYYIAQPGDAAKYCILEMDDAVLGQVAGVMGVNYAFVRNVSDPVVPSQTQDGCNDIPDVVRNEWSSLIYDTFGFYTSYNGALSAWATIAGF
jgi:hypothetical protein